MGEDGTLSLSHRKGTPPSRADATLIAVLAAERALQPSRRIELNDLDEVVLGRGDEERRERRSLQLGFPDRWMSTRHARLTRSGDAWEIEDCQSKNGLFVNGEPAERAALEDGDVLELGHTFFVFRLALAEPAAEPTATPPSLA